MFKFLLFLLLFPGMALAGPSGSTGSPATDPLITAVNATTAAVVAAGLPVPVPTTGTVSAVSKISATGADQTISSSTTLNGYSVQNNDTTNDCYLWEGGAAVTGVGFFAPHGGGVYKTESTSKPSAAALHMICGASGSNLQTLRTW